MGAHVSDTTRNKKLFCGSNELTYRVNNNGNEPKGMNHDILRLSRLDACMCVCMHGIYRYMYVL